MPPVSRRTGGGIRQPRTSGSKSCARLVNFFTRCWRTSALIHATQALHRPSLSMCLQDGLGLRSQIFRAKGQSRSIGTGDDFSISRFMLMVHCVESFLLIVYRMQKLRGLNYYWPQIGQRIAIKGPHGAEVQHNLHCVEKPLGGQCHRCGVLVTPTAIKRHRRASMIYTLRSGFRLRNGLEGSQSLQADAQG